MYLLQLIFIHLPHICTFAALFCTSMRPHIPLSPAPALSRLPALSYVRVLSQCQKIFALSVFIRQCVVAYVIFFTSLCFRFIRQRANRTLHNFTFYITHHVHKLHCILALFSGSLRSTFFFSFRPHSLSVRPIAILSAQKVIVLLSYFEREANLFCYASCSMTTLHRFKVISSVLSHQVV